MSAIPLEDAIERASSVERSNKLPPKALAYFLVVAAAALAVTAPFLAELDRHTDDWLEFVLLATSVAVAQFFVVRAPSGEAELACGGAALLAADADRPDGLTLDPEHSEGSLLGKRYSDEELGLELLCTKAGAGSLTCNGVSLALKGAKPLPASD